MHIKALTLSLLSLCIIADANAASPFGKRNSKTPVEVTSDSLEVLQEQNQATFTGHVVAIQGDVRLTAEKMTVHYASAEEKKSDKKTSKKSKAKHEEKSPDKSADKSGVEGAQGSIKKIDASGSVFLSTPQETASGASGVYDVEHQEINLVDHVVLTRGKNILKGDKLTYNFGTGRSVISSGVDSAKGTGKGKERVRALFVPESSKDKE